MPISSQTAPAQPTAMQLPALSDSLLRNTLTTEAGGPSTGELAATLRMRLAASTRQPTEDVLSIGSSSPPPLSDLQRHLLQQRSSGGSNASAAPVSVLDQLQQQQLLTNMALECERQLRDRAAQQQLDLLLQQQQQQMAQGFLYTTSQISPGVSADLLQQHLLLGNGGAHSLGLPAATNKGNGSLNVCTLQATEQQQKHECEQLLAMRKTSDEVIKCLDREKRDKMEKNEQGLKIDGDENMKKEIPIEEKSINHVETAPEDSSGDVEMNDDTQHSSKGATGDKDDVEVDAVDDSGMDESTDREGGGETSSSNKTHNTTDVSNLETFPYKVYRMLSQVEKKGWTDIVSFNEDGKGFKIHKQTEFAADIMPEHFVSTRLSSFQRQLNLYGFTRISEGPNKGGYYHKYFRRGQATLCRKIKRKKTPSKPRTTFWSRCQTTGGSSSAELGNPNGGMFGGSVNSSTSMSIRQLLADQVRGTSTGGSALAAVAAITQPPTAGLIGGSVNGPSSVAPLDFALARELAACQLNGVGSSMNNLSILSGVDSSNGLPSLPTDGSALTGSSSDPTATSQGNPSLALDLLQRQLLQQQQRRNEIYTQLLKQQKQADIP